MNALKMVSGLKSTDANCVCIFGYWFRERTIQQFVHLRKKQNVSTAKQQHHFTAAFSAGRCDQFLLHFNEQL
jgi:hypothetical protein